MADHDTGASGAAGGGGGMHSMDQPGHMGSSEMGGDSMMMQMVFYQSVKATILFNGVMTKNMGGYLLAIVIIVAGAIFRNWLTTIDPYPSAQKPVEIHGTRSISIAAGTSDTSARLMDAGEDGKRRARKEATGCGACFGAAIQNLRPMAVLLQMANVSLGYLLMLVAMTFNTGLFFAVVVGEAMGRVMFHGQDTNAESMTSGDACH